MLSRNAALALFSLILAGCGASSSSDPVGNRAPTANAGSDRNIARNTEITLDGSASSDPDKDALNYQWTLISTPSGSVATLDGADTISPKITADELGDYTIQLLVNDGEFDSSIDTIVLSAINTAPVAVLDVIRPGSGEVNKIIDVDASNSSDADNDTLVFSWTITAAPTGSSATMSEPDSGGAYFTPDIAGDYTIKLTVSDGVLEDTAEVTVTATNTAPVAGLRVGNSQASSSIGDTILLIPSGSSDDNGDPLSYHFSVVSSPAGSTAEVVIHDPPQPALATFQPDVEGEYTIQLIVNDGFTDSLPVSVTITAATLNLPPIADAGSQRRAALNKVFTLNGGNSADPDGTFLSYSWRFTSKPGGSNATLTDSDSATPGFTPDVAGDYEIQLIVKDFLQDSVADSVIITAFAEGTQPVADSGDDRIVSLGDSVTLDAGASYDPDGSGVLGYSWVIDSAPGGSTANFDNAASATPTLTADVAGDYVISLSVSDGSESSVADTLNLSVQENIGQIETTFGSNGMANSGNDVTQAQNYTVLAMTLDANGNFYLAGHQFIGDFATGSSQMTLWKFNSNGQPDTTFNSSGLLLGSTAASSRAEAVAIDASGNVLAVGKSQPDAASYSIQQLTLWRYDANGVADSSFGSNGRVLLTTASATGASDYGQAVTIDNSGKIYVTGTSYDGSDSAMALWRFNSDGSLDTSFNGSGVVTDISPFGSSVGRDLKIDSNGKIYVAGHARSENRHYDVAIWSFNSDGTVNTDFNSNGKVTMNLSTETGREIDTLYALALDSQNNIIVGGYTAGLRDDALLLKYKPDGTLDTTFNGSGILILNTRTGVSGTSSNSDQIKGIVIDDQDNIYTIGTGFNTFNYALMKFNANGEMDASFNHAGAAYARRINGFKYSTPLTGIALDADNKLYICGTAYAETGTNVQHSDVTIIKYE